MAKSIWDYAPGLVGDGMADDTAAVQAAINALAPGDTIDTSGGAYKVDGDLLIPVSDVLITGKGLLLKDPATAPKPIFRLADFTHHITFEHVRFDGSKEALRNGNNVPNCPAIFGWRNSHVSVLNCKFERMIDAGVKLQNTYGLLVDGAHFFDMFDGGIETRWYGIDPRTGLPWVGGHLPAYGSCKSVNNHFELIGRLEDQNSGLVGGCAWSADIGQGGPRVSGLIHDGNTHVDCLRGFYSENNYPEAPMRDVQVHDNHFEGRRAPPAAYQKQGVGLINVEGFSVCNNTSLNWGNHDPYQSNTTIVVLSGNARKGVVKDNVLIDTSGNVDRMDYGIQLSKCRDVEVSGNRINGASITAISVDQSLCSDLIIFNNPGAAGEYSWGDTFDIIFTAELLQAGIGAGALECVGWSADPNIALVGKCAFVGAAYRLTRPIAQGTLTVAPYINGQLLSSFQVAKVGNPNTDDFVSPYLQDARRMTSRDGAPFLADRTKVSVRYNASSNFLASDSSGTGTGIEVTLTFDRSRKL